MRSFVIVLASAFLAGGCESSAPVRPLKLCANAPDQAAAALVENDEMPVAVRSTPREAEETAEMGPPPPGYYRIVGHAVPDWKPEDMRGGRSRDMTWVPLGPRPITGEYWSGYANASGRVVSIAPHPTNPDVVYIASASGGVWKTTDGGLHWIPLTDQLSILNHGAVALDPRDPNVVYAGTGEYTTQSNGDGLFRSGDGGTTWERIGTTAQVGNTCSRIVVDPLNTRRIHVTGSSGYCRSTDGGASWENTLSGVASDVVVNPLSPSIVFVARHSNGIYRSVNAGQTFTKLTSGLPTTDIQRILLAISRSSPNVLYAAIINSNAGLRGFYQTIDGGDTWTQKTNTPNFPYPQGWYDAFVGVDPQSQNTVYCGGVFPSYAVAGVIKSTDGGNSWVDITVGAAGGQLHPDQHTIAWGPTGTIWVGNDGGVWKTNDGGQSWINTNATLTVTQNYNIALHPVDTAQVMGGTQDNGTVGRELDVLAWPQIVSGDGGFLAYDTNDPLRKYTTYVYLTVFRIRGNDFVEITGPWDNDPRNFIAPLVMAPSDPRTLYGGTNRVWRTTNADTSATWTAISTSVVSDGGTLNAIGLCQAEPHSVYTGSSTGAVYVTINDGVLWSRRSNGLPYHPITDVVVHPVHGAVAYVSYHKTFAQRVLRTADYGSTWTDVTGSLPTGVSADALAVDWRFDVPGLIVGTGAGVYWSYDDGATWTKSGTDLPNVNIGDLQIDFARETVTAGTYGRGAWRARLRPVQVLGDLNCDGVIDFDDINPFVLALSDPAGYGTAFPDCNLLNADCDGNGLVDFGDINPFVALLSGL
jgi:photosystem II stability/assembly factor-like uncharacterized protein